MYGWYDDQWWIGNKEEQANLQRLYNNNCSAAQREQVIGPTLSPLQEEFISNCSKTVDSGVVSVWKQTHTHTCMDAFLALHDSGTWLATHRNTSITPLTGVALTSNVQHGSKTGYATDFFFFLTTQTKRLGPYSTAEYAGAMGMIEVTTLPHTSLYIPQTCTCTCTHIPHTPNTHTRTF